MQSNDQNNQQTNTQIIPVSPLVYRMTVLDTVVNVTADDYLKAINVEIQMAEAQLRRGISDREFANGFHTKGQLILLGLQELRLALNVPQIDEEKEGQKEHIALKNVFEEDEKAVLKKKYIHFVQLFHKHISQLYPDHVSASTNTKNESGPDAG